MISLTFDTDHIDEARMVEFLSEVPVPGAGTFFCTQRFDVLEGTPHEVGPHPPLEPGTDWDRELKEWRAAFPEAQGWRSHSCVFSHKLAEQLAGDGYRYLSTHDDFGRAGLVPHRHGWGIWHMPIFYMDTLDLFSSRFWPEGEVPARFSPGLIETALADDGVYVFDFHPIHLLLNSPSPEYYLEQRDRFRAGDPIRELRFEGHGVLSFYTSLCRRMEERGVASLSARDALERFIAGGAGTQPV